MNGNINTSASNNGILYENTITIPVKRYEELVRAETTLDALCRMINIYPPYDSEGYRAILGERYPARTTTEDTKLPF